jgi:hypothetical protein
MHGSAAVACSYSYLRQHAASLMLSLQQVWELPAVAPGLRVKQYQEQGSSQLLVMKD